tara:strand:- start:129 stop:827 length:699 start_codon:yes stop_codon:yes gene_type:complete
MKIFSLLIPLHNEDKNILVLYNEIVDSLKNYSNYEIIFINDASNDLTFERLKIISKNKSNLIIVNNEKNIGQSLSIIKGAKTANSDIIITIDGDCQNDPKDIIKLYEKYISDINLKLVAGIRLNRKDNIIKKTTSFIANKIRDYFLHDECIDTGCGLKVFDKKIFLNFKEFDGIHRFLPALFKGFNHRVCFISVNHRPRFSGFSKYGTLKRGISGLRDIFFVKRIIEKKELK